MNTSQHSSQTDVPQGAGFEDYGQIKKAPGGVLSGLVGHIPGHYVILSDLGEEPEEGFTEEQVSWYGRPEQGSSARPLDASAYTIIPIEHGVTNYYKPPWTISSTTPRDRPKGIDIKVRKLFHFAKDIVFEHGMESDFSKNLVALVERYGSDAMGEIAHLIISEKVDPEVAAEGLRWFGLMQDPETYAYRMWLLQKGISCSSPRVRDGAALGLSYMDDPTAIDILIEAVQQEPYQELRESLGQVLEQLEDTRKCRSSSDA